MSDARADFLARAERGGMVPVVREVVLDGDTPLAAFVKVARPPFAFLLESLVGGERWARYTFLGTEPLPEYIERVLKLVDRTGVELLHINTGADEIEEAFLRRLEEDRTRGFLRAAAWAATQEIANRGVATQVETETADASIPGHPAV